LDDLERLAMPLAPDIPIDASYLAGESDHERMPSETETRGVIRP